jgi:predicted DNA-binding transcriptional regulator AlpA
MRLLTLMDVARTLGVSYSTAQKIKGNLPGGLWIGTRRRWRERDIAEFTRLSVATVRRWRLLGQGPRYLKIGAAVRYRPSDLAVWLDSRPAKGEVA